MSHLAIPRRRSKTRAGFTFINDFNELPKSARPAQSRSWWYSLAIEARQSKKIATKEIVSVTIITSRSCNGIWLVNRDKYHRVRTLVHPWLEDHMKEAVQMRSALVKHNPRSRTHGRISFVLISDMYNTSVRCSPYVPSIEIHLIFTYLEDCLWQQRFDLHLAHWSRQDDNFTLARGTLCRF